MVLNFTKTLDESKVAIGSVNDKAEFVVFDINEPCSPEEIQIRYSKALWTVVEIINSRYKTQLPFEFNLYNWIEHNHRDELAYFLNEASSNCLNYAQFKAPWKFVVYFGSKGFIVGVLQQGKGFNAELTFVNKVKSNEGAGFRFYEDCPSVVFFDDSKYCSALYLEYLLSQD